jgi:simple sugar transport system ATP-binding protein
LGGINDYNWNEFPLTANTDPIVQMRGIVKRFPGVVANAGVDFDVLPGEIHALLGENGAGKTTLMNVLYGLYAADEGEVLLKGRPVAFASARDAIANGLGMVHQHFMLVYPISVADNIVLGQKSPRAPLMEKPQVVHRRLHDLSESPFPNPVLAIVRHRTTSRSATSP